MAYKLKIFNAPSKVKYVTPMANNGQIDPITKKSEFTLINADKWVTTKQQEME